MGVLDCGAMVMKGYFDVFDRAIGAIEHIEGLLEKQEIPIDSMLPRHMRMASMKPLRIFSIEKARCKQNWPAPRR